jgi:hypothetical protein
MYATLGKASLLIAHPRTAALRVWRGQTWQESFGIPRRNWIHSAV